MVLFWYILAQFLALFRIFLHFFALFRTFYFTCIAQPRQTNPSTPIFSPKTMIAPKITPEFHPIFLNSQFSNS